MIYKHFTCLIRVRLDEDTARDYLDKEDNEPLTDKEWQDAAWKAIESEDCEYDYPEEC